MAEIHIERKKRPLWPWIIGILVLAGLAWIVIAKNNRDQKVAYQESYLPEEAVRPGMPGIDQDEDEGRGLGMTPGDTAARQEKAQAFVAYVNEIEFEEGMGIDNQVTAEGLVKLSEAIQEISTEHQLTVNSLQQTAEQIEQNPESLNQSDQLKRVATNAADALKDIQKNQYPEMQEQVKEVEKAAQSIKEQEETSSQNEEIKEFFEKAASAINSIEKEEQPS